MLLVIALKPFAKRVIFGSLQELERKYKMHCQNSMV
jgi:hypothetical protein